MRWVISFLLLWSTLQAKQLELSIEAEGAILINAKTGAILYEKNAYEKAFPASTTKIATALYALNKCRNELGNKFVATRNCIASISPQAKKQSNYRSPPHWLETDGSHIGIKAGEELRFYDLLCAMLIGSANDASNVIAENVEKSIPDFMEKVNEYLNGIGCQGTTFNNPHGLHHPQHFTTPYDLALMTQVGLKNPIFRRIVSTNRYECPQSNLEYERTILQTNMLLRNGSSFYSKAIGVKTGTTQAAGKNLVAAAEEDGRCLIAVAMGHRGARNNLYRDVTKMFESAFNEPKMRRFLLKKGVTDLTTKVVGARRKLKTVLPEGLYYDYYPAEECEVKAMVNWAIPSLPIRAGTQVGVVEVIDARGFMIQHTPLYAFEDLKPTLWHRANLFFSENHRGRKFLFLSGVCVVLFFFWKLRKKRSRRPLF